MTWQLFNSIFFIANLLGSIFSRRLTNVDKIQKGKILTAVAAFTLSRIGDMLFFTQGGCLRLFFFLSVASVLMLTFFFKNTGKRLLRTYCGLVFSRFVVRFVDVWLLAFCCFHIRFATHNVLYVWTVHTLVSFLCKETFSYVSTVQMVVFFL